jgi:ABC-type multidrug transport system ATPase subunit
VYGLLGPNGAGKTTAVRILTTILHPDGGRAEVLGLDVTRHPQAVRESIGLAGQYAAVDENLTGRENLRLVGRLTHLPGGQVLPRADELLERFGLSDAAQRPVRTYSGGMRRRLTWQRPWSTVPRSFSSTSPPPVSTPPAAASCGA